MIFSRNIKSILSFEELTPVAFRISRELKLVAHSKQHGITKVKEYVKCVNCCLKCQHWAGHPHGAKDHHTEPWKIHFCGSSAQLFYLNRINYKQIPLHPFSTKKPCKSTTEMMPEVHCDLNSEQSSKIKFSPTKHFCSVATPILHNYFSRIL